MIPPQHQHQHQHQHHQHHHPAPESIAMNYQAWKDRLPFRRTRKGVRVDLSLYIYPDGHGNIYDGSRKHGYPLTDRDEAIRVLRDLWEKGTQIHAAPAGPDDRR